MIITLLTTFLYASCIQNGDAGFKSSEANHLVAAEITSAPEPLQTGKREYFFKTAWVWEYHNDLIPAGEWGHDGEMVVYYDSLSEAWLFTPESYGPTDDMAEWILGLPSGVYITSYRDETGRQTVLKNTVSIPDRLSDREKSRLFREQAKPTGQKKHFGENKYGWPVISGEGFKIIYTRIEDQTTYFLAGTTVNTFPLYSFSLRNGDALLPFSFPLNLPPGKLLLEDQTLTTGGKIQFSLKAISDTEYYIHLED